MWTPLQRLANAWKGLQRPEPWITSWDDLLSPLPRNAPEDMRLLREIMDATTEYQGLLVAGAQILIRFGTRAERIEAAKLWNEVYETTALALQYMYELTKPYEADVQRIIREHQ